MKKDSWRNTTTTNKIEANDFLNCDMGQLLSYMYGKVILAIQNDDAGALTRPFLGIYVEGRKVWYTVQRVILAGLNFGESAIQRVAMREMVMAWFAHHDGFADDQDFSENN